MPLKMLAQHLLLYGAGTGGQTYFDNSRLICFVWVNKPVVRDHLKFKNRPVKGSKRASLARF